MVEQGLWLKVRPAASMVWVCLALATLAACGDSKVKDPCTQACDDAGVCSDACVPADAGEQACTPGTVGCTCEDGNSCEHDDGPMPVECVEGRCERVMPELPVPENPVCYTPCSDDLIEDDGSVRRCDSDGLMEGCIGAAVCLHGSCSLPKSLSTTLEEQEAETAPRACEKDSDCPDFQGCRQGGCFSECEVNSECDVGFVCHRHVCRVECNTSSAGPCGRNHVCTSEDGELGVCMPSISGESAPPTPARPEPRFSLSTTSLALTNNTISASFSITNESDSPLTFQVRRADHTEIRDTGRATETKYPLFWMRMGVKGDLTVDPQIELSLGPGETQEVLLRDLGNEELDQWEGHLEVSQAGAGAQSILLTYSTTPDGLWSGSIYYLVNFNEGAEGAIDRWRENPASLTRAEATTNALLAQWATFLSSPLYTLQQWMAVVDSTLKESWSYPLVREACQGSTGASSQRKCYPYVFGSEADDGLATYTDSDSLVIPSGVMEMPFAMALRQVSLGNKTKFTGAVQSDLALQYPGNPGVSLTFSADPSSCEDSGDACLVPIDTFAVTAFTGARYLPESGSCAGGWRTQEQPWLVTSLHHGTHEGDGGLFREECREDSFPRDPVSDALRFSNASLAGANPVPDGQQRERRLELLDGRLINQDTIFMLVRESFDANMDGADSATISGYGMVVLRRVPADLKASDYLPAAEPDAAPVAPSDALTDGSGELSCPDLDVTVNQGNAAEKAEWLILGVPDETKLLRVTNEWDVHYLCHDTGHFDGGKPAWFGGSEREPCPEDSRVTYFLYKGDTPIETNSCQRKFCPFGFCDTIDPSGNGKTTIGPGTCEQVLRGLLDAQPLSDDGTVDESRTEIVVNPVMLCVDDEWEDPTPGDPNDNEPDAEPSRVHCSENRQDLRDEKIFYYGLSDQARIQPSCRWRR